MSDIIHSHHSLRDLVIPKPNLEPYFRLLESNEIFDLISSRKRQIVRWDLAVRTWRKEISTIEKFKPKPKSAFTITMNYLDDPKHGSYPVVWDIFLAQTIIKRENTLPRVWSAENLIDVVRIGSMREQTIPGPIIVVEYPPIKVRKIVIDGNHRIIETYQKNRQAEVVGHLLKFELSREAMIHDEFRLYFDIHFQTSHWLHAETVDELDFTVDIPPHLRT